jgi:hypothetical protein
VEFETLERNGTEPWFLRFLFIGGHRPVDRPIRNLVLRRGLGSTPASPPRAASDADGDVRFYLFYYHPTELCFEQDA